MARVRPAAVPAIWLGIIGTVGWVARFGIGGATLPGGTELDFFGLPGGLEAGLSESFL